MVWNHTLPELDEFTNKLNNFHPTIKFTKEASEYGLPFLDTFVYKEDRRLKTKVYHKPTDNKQYLLYTSCHPKQQINSIPYSLLVRAKIICTKEVDFISEAKSIITKLRKRKYPKKILRTAVERITTINREELLMPKEKKKDSRIRYIVTFNPSNPRMNEITATNIHLLARM